MRKSFFCHNPQTGCEWLPNYYLAIIIITTFVCTYAEQDHSQILPSKANKPGRISNVRSTYNLRNPISFLVNHFVTYLNNVFNLKMNPIFHCCFSFPTACLKLYWTSISFLYLSLFLATRVAELTTDCFK